MIDDVIIIDNVVNAAYQNELEGNFLAEMNAAWYLLDDVAYPGNAVSHQQPGIVHPLFEVNKGIMSPLYNLALPMVLEAITKVNFNFSSTIRGRAFIQFPFKTNHTNHAHIDSNEPHLVCLYYVNDADGDTVIYNETANDIINLPGLTNDMLTIKQTITPKKGRAVLFNGNRYHSSSTPTTNKRCIINFDVAGII
jgi:hypothetical protein